MDQDQEHDADAERPTKELRIEQGGDASRHQGQGEALEFEQQAEQCQGTGGQSALSPTYRRPLRRDIRLDRAIGAKAVVRPTAIVGVAVTRVEVRHYLEDAQAGDLSITLQGRVKLPSCRWGHRAASSLTKARMPMPRV